MFTRILTDKERKRIQAYLRADGERTSAIRTILTRGKQFLPRIEQDIVMIRELMERYEAAKKVKS